MTFAPPRRQPTVTFAFLGLFLLANAQSLQVAGWALAFAFTIWRLMTRSEVPGLPAELGRMILIPGSLLLLGLHGFLGNSLSDYGKDCWYFLAPIIYIAFGYLVGERTPDFKRIVYIFSIVGVLVSLQSLWNIFQNGEVLLRATSAEDYRHVAGIGAGQAMIPAVLIVMCRQAKIDLGILDQRPWLRYLVISVGSMSILLSLSRTLVSILVVGVLVGGARKFLLYAVLGLGLAFAIPQTSAVLDSAASQSFFNKFSRVGEEVELHPYSNMSEINDNWRGFEGYKALQSYRSMNPVEQCFGGGFGKLVDLGFSMDLGGTTEIQEIPILHNGYLYLLVKTGIIGLALFFAFVAQVLLRGRNLLKSRSHEARLCGSLFLWSGLTFLLTQGVITGIYNKGVLAPNLVLLGITTAVYARRTPIFHSRLVAISTRPHQFAADFSPRPALHPAEVI